MTNSDVPNEQYTSVPTILPERLSLMGVRDDEEGFRILLQPEAGGNFFRISYSTVMFYQKSREGERLKTFETLVNSRANTMPIYLVENSKLIKWFDKENLELKGYVADTRFKHWAIVVLDYWVDVLSYVEPIIEELP